MKFRKKPVVIEAIQWIGFWDDLGPFKSYASFHLSDGVLKIRTLEGDMIASIGDWIIRGVKGEYYPCKPDIFEATYEAIE